MEGNKDGTGRARTRSSKPFARQPPCVAPGEERVSPGQSK